MESQSWEFVQVLKNHWITTSTIGCSPGYVRVYDSLHMTLPSTTEKVIADLIMTKEKFFTIEYMDIHRQVGPDDCGLFALAFAASLCYGEQPKNENYNQSQLHSHLLSCLTSSNVLEFL